jgi:hypothetical protein
LLVFTTVIGYALANAGRASACCRQPMTWRRAYGRFPAASALDQSFADGPCASRSTALAFPQNRTRDNIGLPHPAKVINVSTPLADSQLVGFDP